jgi:hypothetical protein
VNKRRSALQALAAGAERVIIDLTASWWTSQSASKREEWLRDSDSCALGTIVRIPNTHAGEGPRPPGNISDTIHNAAIFRREIADDHAAGVRGA